MKPRRVVFFVNTLIRGGTERNVTVLCQHMDKSRYQPEVWTLHAGGENETAVRAAGAEIHCLGRGRSYSPTFALRAAREIARSDADLFHVFLPAMMFYAGLARVLFRASQPIVYSEATSLVTSRWQQPARAWTVRSQCSGFAANSETSRDFLATYGVLPEKIHVIPNGHDIGRFQAPFERQAVRTSIGVGPQDKLAIFVGRLFDTKRVCDLIEAVRLLRSSAGTLRVAIVGDGPERPALEAQVQQVKLTDSVQFLGMRHDVVDLMRAADLFVFPSVMEGLSNAVIEAALAGLPIVGCDIGGVRDVVASGQQCLLVPPRDPQAFAIAMRSYLDDNELARQHGAAARCHAEQSYAIENTLERLYSLYDQVLGTHS